LIPLRGWRDIMARSEVEIIYAGHVQGVGFRFTVKQLARGYDLAGTIRNLPDGRVVMVVQGEREELESFLQAIDESGLGPLIVQKETKWRQVTEGLRGFEIIS